MIWTWTRLRVKLGRAACRRTSSRPSFVGSRRRLHQDARRAALKLALAAAACGSLHEAVVEVEVPAAVVRSSEGGPRARGGCSAIERYYKTTTGPRSPSCFRANGDVLLRRGAARACALLRDPPSSVIQACLALACDSDSVVRANAAGALAPGLSPAAAVVTVAASSRASCP